MEASPAQDIFQCFPIGSLGWAITARSRGKLVKISGAEREPWELKGTHPVTLRLQRLIKPVWYTTSPVNPLRTRVPETPCHHIVR